MLSQIPATSGLRMTQCPVFTASASLASETTPWEIYTGKYRFNNPIPNRVNSWVFIIARPHLWDIPKHKIFLRGAFIFKWNDASSPPICLLILAGIHPNDVVMRLQLKTVAIFSAKTNGMGSGCWEGRHLKSGMWWNRVGSGLRTCCN